MEQPLLVAATRDPALGQMDSQCPSLCTDACSLHAACLPSKVRCLASAALARPLPVPKDLPTPNCYPISNNELLFLLALDEERCQKFDQMGLLAKSRFHSGRSHAPPGPEREKWLSLANLVMRRAPTLIMWPWFLEALSGPERVLASIQTWDFREIPVPP